MLTLAMYYYRSVWLLVMLIVFKRLLVRTELDYRWALSQIKGII